MSQKVPSCTVCGGREFDCSDGLYYCTVCSTQSQAVRDEEVQYCEAYEGRFGGVEVKTDKVKKEVTKKKDYGRPWRTHEGFQVILKEQVKAFIRLGAKSEVLDIAFRLWVLYLGKCGIAFSEIVKPAPDNKLLRSRVRDVYPGMVADPRIKPVRYIVGRKRRNPQFTTRQMLAQNELIEAMNAETFYEGDNPLSFTDEDHGFVAMVQQETEAQLEADQSRNKVGTDFEGLPLFADKADFGKEYDINYLTVSKVLCLAVLSVMYTNPQVTPSDVFGWIKDGQIPYTQAVDLLPDDMHFNSKDADTFRTKYVPTPEAILTLCGRLAVYLELDPFSMVDVGLLASRYITELNLPRELHGFVSNLIERHRPTVQLSRHGDNWLTNPSVLAMAYIVFILRLLFQLDDVVEKQWSEYARQPAIRRQYDRRLFVWDEWVSAVEKQMIVNRAGYFPANLNSTTGMVDVQSAMDHFSAVVEPHTRYTHDSIISTNLANDHMEHMPEELHHLYHRACPAASRHDEMPQLWRKCPVKRQLGSSVPCFSDCTVQYVVDSNRLLHLDTADDVRAGDTSDTVGRSPSRKRPHLDLTTQSTHTTDSQPARQAAASVSDNGEILPPRTVLSYPVYKPVSVKAGVRLRPLSYRWLARHCAEHIHVKPSSVEHYVERLELLHIVPRELQDWTQRVMRDGMVRRCFKRDTKPKRRLQTSRAIRRTRAMLPPRKLL